MIKEIWKDIKGYKGLYQVSNLGRVKSLIRKDSIGRKITGRVMKLSKSNTGYLTVSLFKNSERTSFQVHVLVAIAFLNHIPCGQEIVVDHKDRNKENNRLDNLQLLTHIKNTNKERNPLFSLKDIDDNNFKVFIYLEGEQLELVVNRSDIKNCKSFKLLKYVEVQ